jgi:hypothetical protein
LHELTTTPPETALRPPKPFGRPTLTIGTEQHLHQPQPKRKDRKSNKKPPQENGGSKNGIGWYGGHSSYHHRRKLHFKRQDLDMKGGVADLC